MPTPDIFRIWKNTPTEDMDAVIKRIEERVHDDDYLELEDVLARALFLAFKAGYEAAHKEEA